MKTVIIFIFVNFFCSIGFAGPLILISDIDDTVKVTNVQNPADAVASLKTKESFVGMSQLYGQLLSSRSESKLFYVTGSPKAIEPLMLEFLLDAGLYLGAQLTMKSSTGDIEDYKTNELRRILRTIDPSSDVILIGDNTQKDAAAYATAAAEFSNIKARYIRRVRNNVELPYGSRYFDSALDIALMEHQAGRLNENSIQNLAQEIGTEKRPKRVYIKTTICPQIFPGEQIISEMNLTDSTLALLTQAFKQKRSLCRKSS